MTTLLDIIILWLVNYSITNITTFLKEPWKRGKNKPQQKYYITYIQSISSVLIMQLGFPDIPPGWGQESDILYINTIILVWLMLGCLTTEVYVHAFVSVGVWKSETGNKPCPLSDTCVLSLAQRRAGERGESIKYSTGHGVCRKPEPLS